MIKSITFYEIALEFKFEQHLFIDLEHIGKVRFTKVILYILQGLQKLETLRSHDQPLHGREPA